MSRRPRCQGSKGVDSAAEFSALTNFCDGSNSEATSARLAERKFLRLRCDGIAVSLISQESVYESHESWGGGSTVGPLNWEWVFPDDRSPRHRLALCLSRV